VRALIGFFSRLGFLALLGLGAFWVVDTYAPDRHVPWKPIDLTEPPGAATPIQVRRLQDDRAACIQALREAGVEAVPAEDFTEGEFCAVRNAVIIKGGLTPLSPSNLEMSCPLAAAYVLWDRQVLQPAAREIMGSEVDRVTSFGTYSCRRLYGKEDERPSEHAFANALDVGAIRLKDGREISVKDGWLKVGPEADFLRRLRDGGCEVFGTVLSPDYNEAHHDHLHMDMGQWDFCPLGPATPKEPATPDAKTDKGSGRADKAPLTKTSV